jgi:hypothetical protein
MFAVLTPDRSGRVSDQAAAVGLMARSVANGTLALQRGNRTVPRYGALRVTGANGPVAPAYLEPAGRAARIVVNDSSACSPLTVDPIFLLQ